MIDALIGWSLRNRLIVLAAFVLVLGWGVVAVRNTPIDAIPDLSENQVIVFADWPGHGPQEIEDQVTYPLSSSLRGLAGVRSVRGTSMFGFSLLTVVFEDTVDAYFARTRVLERLSQGAAALPAGVSPRLGPDATGLGWVYQYYLHDTSGSQDLGSLRAVQDYYIRPQLASVAGVAEVASIGGFVRQWQVEVSAERLRLFRLTLGDVIDALARNNRNVGGRTIEENGQEFVVRGRALIGDALEIESILLSNPSGTPIRIADVAAVRVGGDYRRGTLDVGGREAVGGAVVMRTGENAHRVIREVKERIAAIAPGMPVGVSIEPFYDRSGLIDRAIGTLRFTLWESVALVTLVHIVFLFHFRSILIVTLPLPASILISFILMEAFGIQSHIMSLTGIAIAIGVLVDAAIVLVENVLRHCELATASAGRAPTPAEVRGIVLQSSRQVGRPIFFAMGIIILAFVPVFGLTGQEGKLFHPLAWAKTFAMAGATALALTVVPVLCTFLVRGPFHPEGRNLVMRGLLALYDPVLEFALRRRAVVLGCAAALLAYCAVLAFGIPGPVRAAIGRGSPGAAARIPRGFGREFMPPLNEGSLLFMPVLLPSTSLTEVKRIMAWQDRVIREAPEVASVVGKLGRYDSATDPAPVEMIETTIMLKPRGEWRAGMTGQRLVAELGERLAQVPGYAPGFLQPIENRILMLSTGIRAQVGIKVFGDELDALQAKADEIAAVVQRIPGAAGVAASRVQGKPYVEIFLDRVALARYGLAADEVLAVVETGLGGTTATTAIKGRERWPVQVRLQESDRDDLDRLAEIPFVTPSGAHVKLGQVASISRVTGPNEIGSENGRLRAFVQTNVAGRDLASFVREARERVAAEVALLPGMSIEWSGQYENQVRAERRLLFILPAVLGIIFIILVVAFRSAAEAAHVVLAVPFALTGGVLLQAFLGFNFSVAAWVGYIALFGTAIQTGIVMVVYLEEAVERRIAAKGGGPLTRAELLAAVKEGARLRLRPKVMTAATAIAGLLPIFWSTRTGVEVMRPIAAPVVGGMLSSLVHILVITPVLFLWLRERRMTQ